MFLFNVWVGRFLRKGDGEPLQMDGTTTTSRRHHRMDGEYVVDLCTSRAGGHGRFSCPPTMVFIHKKTIPMKEASGG
ncbi:hypothetical protein RB195_023995 [Necator americanus]|uniref:Transthyretin-like family protein n=1 Tax=Necator americanus TaxID=51031 RepID=A0ABR1EM81_NECAM